MRSLAPAEKRYDVTDSTLRGFGVRVEPDGRRIFWARWWDGERRQRLTLGEYPHISLSQARQRAEEVRVQTRSGVDPRGRKPSGDHTFGAVAELYLDLYARPNKKSWRQDERLIRSELAAWSERPVAEIRRPDAVAILDTVARRGSPATARFLRAVISRIYNWLAERGGVEHNPVTGIRLPGSAPRQRVLTEEEIGALWRTWCMGSIVPGCLFRLLLATGARPGEGLRAEWSQISGRWWHLPETKSGAAHRIYLSDLSLDILEEVRTVTRTERWVFASPRHDGEPMYSANTMTRRYREASGVLGWTAHDLRRTCATYMGRLEIDDRIIDRCLNHAVGKITRTYNRARYEKVMAEAWTAWGDSLGTIVRGS